MLPFLIVLIVLVLAAILIFTPNPIIVKLHGGPIKINKKKVKKVMLWFKFLMSSLMKRGMNFVPVPMTKKMLLMDQYCLP